MPDSDHQSGDFADLALRIGRGDKNAESKLYTALRDRLLYFVRRKLFQASSSASRESVEDICQDAWIAVLENLRNRKLQDPQKLSSYIYQIFSNKVIDEATRLSQENTVSISEGHMAYPIPAADAKISLGLRQAFTETWELLRPRDKRVLYLRYVHLWSHGRIASVLGTSEENCRKCLQRAKQRFRKKAKTTS